MAKGLTYGYRRRVFPAHKLHLLVSIGDDNSAAYRRYWDTELSFGENWGM